MSRAERALALSPERAIEAASSHCAMIRNFNSAMASRTASCISMAGILQGFGPLTASSQ